MWESVVEAFPLRFSAPLEGNVPCLYVDVNGAKVPPVPCVTTAIGCLVDPIQLALDVQWAMPDGSLANQNQIATQWRLVKADAARLSTLSWHEAAKLTTMRLTDDGVTKLVLKRLYADETMMRMAFPSWETWPADAQLYACSMAWAVGAGWPGIFRNCTALLNSRSFLLAATGSPTAKPTDASAACDIKVGTNYGIVPRNAQNRLLLSNAQVVVDRGLDPSVLHWPKSPLNDTDPSVNS